MARVLEWQLNQWDARPKKEWREAMELAFKTLYDSSPSLRQTIEKQKNRLIIPWYYRVKGQPKDEKKKFFVLQRVYMINNQGYLIISKGGAMESYPP